MKQVVTEVSDRLQKGIPLTIRKGHTVRLEVTQEPLTVQTGLSLFYAMAEALGIPKILDTRVKVKKRERVLQTFSPSFMTKEPFFRWP